jgi:hypothetical protein
VLNTHKEKPSQTCPCCGSVRKKALAERVHQCGCGFAATRDCRTQVWWIHKKERACTSHKKRSQTQTRVLAAVDTATALAPKERTSSVGSSARFSKGRERLRALCAMDRCSDGQLLPTKYSRNADPHLSHLRFSGISYRRNMRRQDLASSVQKVRESDLGDDPQVVPTTNLVEGC